MIVDESCSHCGSNEKVTCVADFGSRMLYLCYNCRFPSGHNDDS